MARACRRGAPHDLPAPVGEEQGNEDRRAHDPRAGEGKPPADEGGSTSERVLSRQERPQARAVSVGHDGGGIESHADSELLQRRAEELGLSNEILERRVEERTRALEAEIAERNRIHESMREAQKLEAIGQMAGGIAHDFNNLLTVVMGNAGFLEDRLPPGLERQSAGTIVRAAERGARLVRQILAFS